MNIYKIFFEAMLKGGPKSIVEAAYLYFQRPITVIDVSYRLICQLPEESVEDVVFDAILNNQGTPNETVMYLEEGKYRDYLAKHPEASFVDWGNLEIPRIMGAIKIKNRIAGYYAVLYKEGSPTDTDLEVAQMFAEAMSKELNRQERFYLLKDELGSTIMRDVVNDVVDSKTLLAWDKKNRSINLWGYQLVCAAGDGNILADLEYICRLIEEKYKGYCFSIVHDSKIYLLFYNLGRKLENQKNVNRVIDCLVSFNLICGISESFFDITQIGECKFMTEEMLSLYHEGEKQKIFHFRENAFRSMIHKINDTKYAGSYIHPKLNVLIKYDETYFTNYTETLEVYLLSFKSLTSAAEKLKIHRNTLKYRIQKISEITDLDFQDDRLCAELMINMYSISYRKMMDDKELQ